MEIVSIKKFNMSYENEKNALKTPYIIELLGENIEDAEKLSAEYPLIGRLLDALFISEAMNRAMFEGYQGMVFLVDSNLKVVSANSSSKTLCPEPIGKYCNEIFQCENGKCKTCVVRDLFEAKSSEKLTKNITTQDALGGEIFFELSCLPVKSRPDVIDFVVIVARDVTEKRKLEKQLRHAHKMEAVGTLAGGIAHDFNNLLTPIMGYSEIIRMHFNIEKQSENEVTEYVDEILKAAKRAKKLVEQILTFSRSGEQKESLQYLHPIVKEVMKFIQTTLPSTIRVTREIDENCGMVFIDPVQVHHILINMCTNSANAIGGKPGKITVRLLPATMPDDDRAWLELGVSDNGVGIEPHLRDRIFEPYFTTREKEQGTGMGLAMLHGVVKRQGGKIEVDSEVGVGTTFHVFMPISEKETSPEQIINPRHLIGGNERILLVDDEEQVVDVASRILESLGYNVTSTTSARETLLLFTENCDNFDLIITDQMMPYMTGIELCKKIKEIRSDIPVILFTGNFGESIEDYETPHGGIDGVCMKPVSFKEMAESVRKVIDKKDLET